jgi:hypothetical protein
MTAEEKFESRLKELGLWERWCTNQQCGRIGVVTDTNTIVLVHEYDGDDYTEFRFPLLSQLSEDKEFRAKALAEFVDAGDEKFIRDLVWWFLDAKNGCPLYPEDVYSIWSECTWENFEDDKEEYVMDCTNNHYAFLVTKINQAYKEKQEDFYNIVRLLAERDERHDILSKSTIFDVCHDYCQNIADNTDLETILFYCRV